MPFGSEISESSRFRQGSKNKAWIRKSASQLDDRKNMRSAAFPLPAFSFKQSDVGGGILTKFKLKRSMPRICL